MTLFIKLFIIGIVIGQIGALFHANPILTGIIAYIVGYEFDIIELFFIRIFNKIRHR